MCYANGGQNEHQLVYGCCSQHARYSHLVPEKKWSLVVNDVKDNLKLPENQTHKYTELTDILNYEEIRNF